MKLSLLFYVDTLLVDFYFFKISLADFTFLPTCYVDRFYALVWSFFFQYFINIFHVLAKAISLIFCWQISYSGQNLCFNIFWQISYSGLNLFFNIFLTDFTFWSNLLLACFVRRGAQPSRWVIITILSKL